MQTIINFVIKNLKLNKKRTTITIISIMLSTALICSLSGIFFSFRKSLIQNSIKTDGNYHATFYNIPVDKEDIITKNSNTLDYFVTQNMGYSKLLNSKDKQFIYLISFDKKALKNYGLNLVEGRLPENDSELLISDQIQESGSVNYNLKDEIDLDVGDVVLPDGSKLTQQSYATQNDIENAKFNNKFTKTYTIVGKIKRPNMQIEPYTSYGYTAITCLDKTEGNANFSVRFKNVKDTYNLTNQIIKKDTANQNAVGFYINYNLLRWYGALQDDNLLVYIYISIGLIISIIIVTSIFVIKNCFEISTSQKVRQYSILSCIGATKKQIKKIVAFENFILGFIGVILGIVLGFFVTYILIKITSIIVLKNTGLGDFEFVFSMPIIAIVISVILSTITIYLSSLKSIKYASSADKIDAIRNSSDIKVDKSSLKSPLVIDQLFKVGGDIAYKNLKRNSKMYKATVISLIICVTLFITFNTILKYSDYIINNISQNLNYNVAVNYNDYEEENKKYDTFKKIAALDNVKSYSILRLISENTDLSNYVDLSNIKLYQKLCFGSKNLFVPLSSIGEDEYKRFVAKLDKSYQDVKDKIIYISNNNTYVEDSGKKIKLLNLKEGDKISFQNPNTKQKTDLDIGCVTNISPMGFENSVSATGIFLISDEMLEKIGGYSVQNLFINSNDSEKLCTQIKTYSEKLYITNTEAERQQQRRILLIVSIFMYGFVIVITTIGVTSIINTLNTSMQLRSKEFAMLKSIGTTKKELSKMINLESIFYSVKSLTIGISLGIILSFAIYELVSKFADVSYIFPLKSIIISIIFVEFIVLAIMRSSLKKINKQNIIEAIRKENT